MDDAPAPVSWGILGTGRFADTWMAPAIKSVPGCRLAAVGSRDSKSAGEFAAKHGVDSAYGSYRQVIEDPSVQVIYIGTPNSMHAEQVKAAAGAGKHVLCDKPLALSSSDALDAVDACSAAGVVLGINFQYRQHPAFVAARDLIRGGAIGEVLVIQAESGGNYPLRSWRQDRALAGMGAVLNLGVHAYDLMSFLVGQEVTELCALTNDDGPGLETLALTLLRLASGSFAYVNANQIATYAQPDLTIYGSQGRLVATNCLRMGVTGRLQLVKEKGTSEWEFSSEDLVARVVAQFASCIGGREAPTAGALDGVRSVGVAEAIDRSAATGSRISLELTRKAEKGSLE